MMIPQPDSAASFGPANNATRFLYFLTSAATSGPLAGLVKVGITDNFPARHAQHRAVWGEFDLCRSALLRTGRREVRLLELAIRHAFGNPDAMINARQAGKVLTNADYIAMGSWRRHPGRCDEGHTEFFAAKCAPDMLDLTDFWLRCRSPRASEDCLKRGLTTADCALRLDANGNVAPALTKEERRQRRAQQQAEREHEQAEFDAMIVGKVRRLLDLALAYEEYLTWVDLSRWRIVRAENRLGVWVADGIADLYFGGFGPAPFAEDAAQQPVSLARTKEEFLRIEVPVTEWPDKWHLQRQQEHKVWRQQVGYWQEPPLNRTWNTVPPPCCREALRVRLAPVENEPARPFYDEFAALARRVEARGRWGQPDLLPTPEA